MKEILNHLFEHKTLTKEEAKTVLIDIASGKHNHAQIDSFLTAFIMRNISLDELEGFRDAMLELCIPVDLSEFDPIDLCGTGGDGKNTFNISTLASFVVAGAEIPVAKHGNYGVSSVSGSSNVLEYLGVKFTNEQQVLKQQISEAGICFLHAPLFHTAMKHVAPVRKELGVKTFFNMLGPLVNPAMPMKQLVGVFNLDIARMYQYLFQKTDHQYSIVHALDGFDEISLTGSHKRIYNNGEELLNAEDFGFFKTKYEDLFGGNKVEEAASIFTEVINGRGTETQNNVVIANAATAIQTYFPDKNFENCLSLAKESLLKKQALKSLNSLISIK